MYWLEVERANGNKQRHESQDLNALYELHVKYSQQAKQKVKRKTRPVVVRAGTLEQGQTGEWRY